MLAAILFCGLTTTVLTSCGGDDDDNNSQQPTPTPEPAAEQKYDVTLIFLTYKTISAFIDCEFSYTDHNGKKSTPVIITGKENGENLTSTEMAFYKTHYNLLLSDKLPESKFLEYVAFHYTIKDVPAGSKISWETIQHTAEGATVPTEELIYVWPTVMYTVSNDNNFRMDISKLHHFPAVITESKAQTWFDEYVTKRDGQTLSYATGSLEATTTINVN